MKSEYILKADILDIIFDQRNKSYGAYPLRKFYHERIYKALGIIFGLIAIFSLYTLFQKKAVIYKVPDLVTSPFYIPPTLVEKKPTPSQPQKPSKKDPGKKTGSQKWLSKIVTVDDQNKPDKLIDLTDSMTIGSKTIVGFPGDRPILNPVRLPGSRDSATEKNRSTDKTLPLHTAEIMPAYPGGMEALKNFLEKNLHNPRDLEEGEVISVKVMFIVGFDGLLKGFETVEDGGSAFSNEVIRVLKKMPEWIPGKANGENVSVYYTIPVKFISKEQ